MMQGLDPGLLEREDIALLMAGCSYGELEALLSPQDNIHLANDNCPHQVVVCGEIGSIHQLSGRLREKQVIHQQLPFRSGFHSPFLTDRLHLLREAYQGLRFKKPVTPLWSATTLEEYPDTHYEIIQLGIRHLTEPVRFRQLTERLYTEGVRLFIQVGSGGLVGFIEDTLRGRSFSAVAANSAARPGLAQLRRVLAALYVEGRQELHPLLAPAASASKRAGAGQPMTLQLGTPLLKSLESIQQIAGRHFNSDDGEFAAGSSPLLAAMLDNQQQMK